jgi:hypothetical protein
LVDISYETSAETDERLRHVIAAAELKVYEQSYIFAEFPPEGFPSGVDPEAIALVRDDQTWSQLVPDRLGSAEPFTLFRFHFPAGLDNSGFVGWLATHLKRRLGTGVFVVCGHNGGHGGIFDYWGCPESLREAVLAEIAGLVSERPPAHQEVSGNPPRSSSPIHPAQVE